MTFAITPDLTFVETDAGRHYAAALNLHVRCNCVYFNIDHNDHLFVLSYSDCKFVSFFCVR